MFDVLAKFFGIDPNSDGVKLAQAQIAHDRHALQALIDRRLERFDDAANFAARIGVSTEELSQFEQDPVDFDLPFIRAYAHGLGVEIVHYVQEFRAPDAAAQFALMEAQYSQLDRAKALHGSKPSR